MENERMVDEVDCPRCLKPCAWCSDYRYQHGPEGGLLGLPNRSGRKRLYCTVLKNTDTYCPLCGAAQGLKEPPRKVRRTIVYEPLPADKEGG